MNVKFYTTALIAGLAISATAAETVMTAPMLQRSAQLDPSFCKTVKLSEVQLKKYSENTQRVKKAPATGKDLTGDYLVSYANIVSDANNGTGMTAGYCLIEEGSTDNEYMITMPFTISDPNSQEVYEFEVVFPATVEGNVLTITNSTVNIAGESIAFGCFETYVNDQNYLVPREIDKIETIFTGSGFIFRNQNEYFGAGDTKDGFYFLAGKASFQKEDVPDSEMNIGWKSLGTAKLQDGWLSSNFTSGNQADPEYMMEVELQQNESEENIYRIVNPYGANTWLGEYNDYADRNGFIQFNMKDPDHVVFEPVPANFANADLGIDQLYAINTLGMLVFAYGWDVESAVKKYGDSLDWATFKDNVLTLPCNVRDGANSNDAQFGMAENPCAGYSWVDQDRKPINMEAKIFFPSGNEGAVEGVEMDENAPVKYFNLQGMEVAQPAKGQLVIKKQGSKSVKMIAE